MGYAAELSTGQRETCSRKRTVSVELACVVRPPPWGTQVSARRVARVGMGVVLRQTSACIVTPPLQPMVDECVIGRLRLAPETVSLLRDLIEDIVLITLPIRTSRRPAVRAVDVVTGLRAGVSFAHPRGVIVTERAIELIIDRMAEAQLSVVEVLIGAGRPIDAIGLLNLKTRHLQTRIVTG